MHVLSLIKNINSIYFVCIFCVFPYKILYLQQRLCRLWMQPYCSSFYMIQLRIWRFYPDITAGMRKMSYQVGRRTHSYHLMRLNLGRWPLKNSSWRTTSVHMPLTSWLDMAGWNMVFELRASGYCYKFRHVQTFTKLIWEVILCLHAPQKYTWMSKQSAFACRFPQ